MAKECKEMAKDETKMANKDDRQNNGEEREAVESRSVEKEANDTATRFDIGKIVPKSPKGSSKSSSIDSACEISRKTDTDVYDSDDYDDVYDEIYENVNHRSNTTDEDGPIYDNVDCSCDSGSDHIYSNVDELSDAGSHIYTNIDSVFGGELESEEDDYENIEFVYRKCGSFENTNDADESENSSVSYENLDFLDGNENEAGDESRTQKEVEEKPPLVIPRRVPLVKKDVNVIDKLPSKENISSVS